MATLTDQEIQDKLTALETDLPILEARVDAVEPKLTGIQAGADVTDLGEIDNRISVQVSAGELRAQAYADLLRSGTLTDAQAAAVLAAQAEAALAAAEAKQYADSIVTIATNDAIADATAKSAAAKAEAISESEAALTTTLAALNLQDGINGNQWYAFNGTPTDAIGVIDDFALVDGRYTYKHNGTVWIYHSDLLGPQGDTPAVTDNLDGTYTIVGSNGTITISDGNSPSALIPTVTDNGNGTYTIEDGNGGSVIVNDSMEALPISILPASQGGNGTLIFNANQLGSGTPNDGEIRVQGTKFIHPNGTSYSNAQLQISTHFEGGGSTGRFYILWSATSVDTRFSTLATDIDDGNLVIAVVNVAGTGWDALSNLGVREAITLVDTDCFVGVGYRNPDKSNSGIDTLFSFMGGYSPLKGIDYFDGTDGSFVSFIFRNGTTKPTPAPTGGTFNGTAETFPSNTDDKPTYVDGQITWVSKTRYTKSGAVWSNNGWSDYVEYIIKGPSGNPVVVEYTASTAGTITWNSTFSAGMLYMRQKIEGGLWSDPIRIVGEHGTGGDYISYRFSKSNSTVTPSTPETLLIPSGWDDAPPSLLEGEYLWMSKAQIANSRVNGGLSYNQTLIGTWSTPVRISGKDALELVVVSQYWGFTNTADGFTSRNGTLTPGTTAAVLVTSSVDPSIVRTGLNVQGDTDYIVATRLRCTSHTLSNISTLYYSTTTRAGHTGLYQKTLPTTQFNQNEWVTLVFDMRDLTAGGTDWIDGIVDTIRLDHTGVSATTWEFDYFQIGHYGSPKSSKSLNVTATSYTMSFDKTGTVFGTSPIVITANAQNLGGTLSWSSSGGTPSGNTYSLPASAFASVDSIVVTATQDGFSDSTTITRLDSGSGALSLVMSNPTHMFAADSGGTISSLAGSDTEIKVYEGSTLLKYTNTADSDTYDTSTAVAGEWKILLGYESTGTISAPAPTDSGDFATTNTLNSMGSDSATLRIPIMGKTLDGTPFTMTAVQSFTKSKQGGNGLHNAIVYLYKRASSIPAKPSTTSTYTFSSKVLSGFNNSWQLAVPTTGTDPIYVIAATASSQGVSDTIVSNDWSAPAILASNGVNGLNSATVSIYQRLAGLPANPRDALPTAAIVHTFSPSSTEAPNNGWTLTIPEGANPLYISTATAVSSTSTDSIPVSEWADPTVLVEHGLDGSSAVYNNLFDTSQDQSALITYVGTTATTTTDSFSGTSAMSLTSTVSALDSSGSGNVVYLVIPEDLALRFVGLTVILSVYAKAIVGNESSTFSLAYSTADVGNSGFTAFAPTANFVKYEIRYLVPAPIAGGPDYILISPDDAGLGRGIIIDNVQCAVEGPVGQTGLSAFEVWKLETGQPSASEADYLVALTGSSYTGTTEYYLNNNIASPAPLKTAPGWSTGTPALPTSSNKYLWNYNSNTRTVGDPIDSPVSLITQYVKDGRGISSIAEAYQRGALPNTAPTGTWTTFALAGTLTEALSYMWNRTTISYTDGSTSTVKETMIAAKGDQGDAGVDGYGSLTLINTGDCSISGDTITKLGTGTAGWNAGVHSKELFVTSVLTFSVADLTGRYIVGLSKVAPTDTTWTNMAYAIHPVGDSGSTFDMYVYEGGQQLLSTGLDGYSITDVFKIVNDGAKVRYYINNTLWYTSENTPSGTYGFDSSIYHVGGSITGVTFNPAGYIPLKDQDYFDGTGNYVSYVYRIEDVGTTPAQPTQSDPTNGTFSTSEETPPTSPATWTLTPQYAGVGVEWVSKAVYRNFGIGAWYRVSDWSEPAISNQKGDTGDNTITMNLSNDIHTVPTDSAGNSGSFDGAVTTAYVFNGSVDDSTNWTYVQAVVNLTGTASGSLRSFTVTGMSANTGHVDITASRTGYTDITKRFSVSKSLQGNEAVTSNLSNDTHIIPTDAAGLSPNFAGAVSSITIFKGLTNDSTNWVTTATPSAGVSGASSNGNRTYTVSGITGDVGIVTFSATRSGHPTQVKVFTITKGKQGNTGEQGTGMFTLLTQDNNVTIVSNTVTKNTGVADGWNASAYSIEIYPTSTLSVVAPALDNILMVGLSKNDGSVSSYTANEYNLYFHLGTARVYELTTNVTAAGQAPYTVGDVFSIVNDGKKVRYLKNGVMFWTSTVTPSGAYRLDCSLHSASASVGGLSYTFSGAAGDKGAKHYYLAGLAWNAAAAETFIETTNGDELVKWDVVTIFDEITEFSVTKYWHGTNDWRDVGQVIDGSLLVKGSIKANSVNVDDVFTKDINATNTITGAKLVGGRLDITSAGSSSRVVIDSLGESPIVITDGVVDVLRFDSDNKLKLSGGLADGVISNPKMFSDSIWAQIQAPLSAGATGGSFTGVTQSGVSPRTSTFVMTNVNANSVLLNYRFVNSYDGSNSATPQWTLYVQTRTRPVSGTGSYGSTHVHENKTYTGSKISETPGLYEQNLDINFSKEVSPIGVTVGGDIEVTITATYVAGGSTTGSLYSLSASQAVAGGGVAGNANTLENQTGAYYLNWNNFSNKPTIPTLSTSVTSTSTTVGATSSAVKTAYDVGVAALPKAGGTLTGKTLITGTGTIGGGVHTNGWLRFGDTSGLAIDNNEMYWSGTTGNFGTIGNYDINLNLNGSIGALTPSGIDTSKRIKSTVATGTAPFTITSTTKVANLNVDMLDGLDSSAFATAGHTHSYLPLAGGTLTGNLHITAGSPTLYFRDTDGLSAMLHNNSDVFYILRGATDGATTWTTYDSTTGSTSGRWPLQINLTNAGHSFAIGSTNVTAGGNTVYHAGKPQPSVTGNAGTVTNGVYLGTTQTLTNKTLTNPIIDRLYAVGDTDTYTEFHAADQWRVVTGGVERIEVNNDNLKLNNVGLVLDNGNHYTIPAPKGGYYNTSSNVHTGAIMITLPVLDATDMYSFWVDIFDYTTGESISVYVGTYSSAASNNPSAMILSSGAQNKDFTVRFGNTASKNCVWIGELNSTWSYPQIIVRDVNVGFTATNTAWEGAWSVSFATAFNTVDVSVTANYPHAGNANTVTGGVYTSGNQSISGTKTFTSNEIKIQGASPRVELIETGTAPIGNWYMIVDAGNFSIRESSTSTIRFQIDLGGITRVNSSLVVTDAVIADELRTYNGNTLVINAGESANQATGQTAEKVFLNAEGGIEINSSPDNWVSGWAGRKTTSIGTIGITTDAIIFGIYGNGWHMTDYTWIRTSSSSVRLYVSSTADDAILIQGGLEARTSLLAATTVTAGSFNRLGADNSFGANYGALSFGTSSLNGTNRIAGHKSGGDGLILCSATAKDIFFRPGGSVTNNFRLTATGAIWINEQIFADKDRTITTGSLSNKTKFRTWNNAFYGMGMSNGSEKVAAGETINLRFGGLSSYAMTFQMHETADYGFWWGHRNHKNYEGAMSLTNDGRLVVATSMRVGGGQANTSAATTGYELDVQGNILMADAEPYLSIRSTDSGNSHLRFQTSTGAESGLLYASNTKDVRLRVGGSDSATYKTHKFDASGNSTFEGNLTASGTVTGSDCIATSDIRSKINFEPITNALEKICQLNGKTYDHLEMQGDRAAGHIAQEVELVLPEAVSEIYDERLGKKKVLSTTAIPALHTEAIKELKAENDELKERLAKLEALVARLVD